MEFPFQLPLLLDGAAVSNLEALGMEPGECSELWALEHPGLLLSLQKDFLAAGAHALCAPTYGANRALLTTYGLAEKTKELNEGLIRLTKEATKAAGKEEIPVGGRIGPSGLFPPPMGEEDFDSIYTLYREQIRALSKAGADFLMIEDQSSLADMRAAVLAARTTNLPVFVTLAVDSSGRTLTGCTLLSALITLQAMGIEAIGLSCSSPESMRDSLKEAYPHACIPLIARPDVEAHISPEDFGDAVLELTRWGAAIVGGCCGATPEHIAAIAQRLPSSPISFLPNPSEIPEEDTDCLAAAIEGETFFLGDDILLSEPLSCSSQLADDMIDLEDERINAVLVQVESIDDALLLAQQGKMARLPIAVHCDSIPVLEAALRYFQGRLIVDSDCELEKEELIPLVSKYGAILY